ncbi:MAG: LCCL domain-containing protein [Pseudomonadota bacterium]
MKKGPSLGIGLWFDYDNVFQGFTITPGFGAGVDFGGVVYAGTAVDGDETVGCDGRRTRVTQSASAYQRATASATTPRGARTARRPAACPSTAQKLRGTSAAVICLCSASQTKGGRVWGSNPYTDDSNVCRAAVHAGVIPAGGGTIRFQPAAGQSSFAGSTRSGVTTSRYGAWPASIRVFKP